MHREIFDPLKPFRFVNDEGEGYGRRDHLYEFKTLNEMINGLYTNKLCRNNTMFLIGGSYIILYSLLQDFKTDAEKIYFIPENWCGSTGLMSNGLPDKNTLIKILEQVIFKN